MLEFLCLTAWNANGDGDIIVICKLGYSVVIWSPKEETHVAFVDVNFSTSAVLQSFPQTDMVGDNGVDCWKINVCVNWNGCCGIVDKCKE